MHGPIATRNSQSDNPSLPPKTCALSPNARRFVDFLLIEHMNHAGTENGNLIATYAQLTRAGASRRLIGAAIDECVFLGLVRVEQRGGLSAGGKHAARYRLTFYASADGAPPTNEWKAVDAETVRERRDPPGKI